MTRLPTPSSPSPRLRGEGWGEGLFLPPSFSATTHHARTLRQHSTHAETTLWNLLKNRQCAGAKFRRQHPIGPYIVDFCCPESHLIIEADGGQHAAPEHDAQRDTYLTSQGYTLLRFWNNDILTNTEAVWQRIHDTLTTPSPQPSPPPGVEGASPHLSSPSSVAERTPPLPSPSPKASPLPSPSPLRGEGRGEEPSLLPTSLTEPTP